MQKKILGGMIILVGPILICRLGIEWVSTAPLAQGR